MTSSQKSWTTIVGVLLLIAGVVIAGIFYGDVVLTVVGGVIAVILANIVAFFLMRAVGKNLDR